jgi:outer membrane protein assembly factor BamD (BamD/ComL family)
MKRFEDAQAAFKRLVDSYPGSVVAESATKELAAINGMKNEPEEPAEKKEEAKAAEAAPVPAK